MKFTLISEYEDTNGPKITYEFEEDFLEVVVENIEQFLKGSGFVFGSLEVNQESNENSSWDDDEEIIDLTKSANSFTIDTRDDNMSSTWPFPLNRPEETVTLHSEK